MSGKMIERKMKIDSTIKAKAELTVSYANQFSERRCVIGMEHEINHHNAHSLMCCPRPIKSVHIEEGYKLKTIFKQCGMCDKCDSNATKFLSTFTSAVMPQ